MKKKYLLNGKVYDEETLNGYAQQSQLPLGDYLKEAGAKEFPNSDTYSLNGKDYDSHTVAEYAQKNDMAFDAYLKEAGFKKKDISGESSAPSASASSGTEPQPVAQPVEENPIDLALKATDLSKKTRPYEEAGITNASSPIATQAAPTQVPDEQAVAESQKLKDQLKAKGYDEQDVQSLSNDFSDFPAQAFDFTHEDGTKPYSKDNLLKLRGENPVAYKQTLNSLKNQYDIYGAVKQQELAKGEKPEMADYKATVAANAFNALHESNNLPELYANIKAQQGMLSEALTGEERDKALQRVEQSASHLINSTNPQMQEEYKNSGLQDVVNLNQYAGLKQLQLFEPAKYEQAINILKLKPEAKYELVGGINPMTGETSTSEQETEASVNQRKGLEATQKMLADIGRGNALVYAKDQQFRIAKALQNATDPQAVDQLQNNLIGWQKVEQSLVQDTQKDAERYPLLTSLKADMEMKEITQQAGMSPLEYGIYHFGKGFENPLNTSQDIVTSLFGSDADNASLQSQRLGENETDRSIGYLPSGLQMEQPNIVPKFSKEIRDESQRILNNPNLSEQDKHTQITQLIMHNQDGVNYVTNPEAGKTSNHLAKAIAYSNTGALGDILSIAAQSYALGSAGLGSLAANATPMFSQAYDDFYRQAVEDGAKDKSSFALTHALIMAAAGMINPDLNIVKRSLGINTLAGKTLAGIDEATWNAVIEKNKGLLGKIQNATTSVGKEAAKMGAVYGAGTSVAGDVADNLLFDKKNSTTDIIDHAVRATKDLTLNSLALFGINAISNFRSKTISPDQKARIWEVGTNPEIGLQEIDDAVRSGQITDQQGEERKEQIKRVSALMTIVPRENMRGKMLTDKERLDYLYNLIVKMKGHEIETGMPEAKKETIQDAISAADADNNRILNGNKIAPKEDEKAAAIKEEDPASEVKNAERESPAPKSIADKVREAVAKDFPMEDKSVDEQAAKKTDIEERRQNELADNATAYEGDEQARIKADEETNKKHDQELTDLEKQQEPEMVTEKAGASLPYVNEFVDQDVKPLLHKWAEGSVDLGRWIVNKISPKTGVKERAVTLIQNALGERNKANQMVDKVMSGYEKMFDTFSQDENIAFIDRIKRGEKQPTKDLQMVADLYGKLDKDLYDEITKYKPNMNWKDDHYRVLWKVIPGSTVEKQTLWSRMKRRPFEGSKGFSKQATLLDMSEGIRKGGEPVTYNPVKMFKLAYDDAMRFVTAHRMMDGLKKAGDVKLVEFGERPPEGYVQMNDRIADKFFRSKEGGSGKYWIEQGAGRLFNNHLSADKIREKAAGRLIMDIKNVYTQMELSFSVYHLAAESLETISSDIGLGLRKIFNLGVRGDIKSAGSGIMDILKSPYAPKTTFSLGSKFANYGSLRDWENTKEGQAFVAQYPDIEDHLHYFFMGGNLMHQHEDLKANTYKALKESMEKNNYIGAAVRAIPTMNEVMLSPIFNHIIPRLKMGMWLKEWPTVLKENAERLEKGHVTKEQLARITASFIDDRMGEMNFDNLFWDRTFKTSMQFFMRSVTWKLGNIRSMVGAFPEQGLEIYNAGKEGRVPMLMPKLAWLFGLTAMQTALASITQHALAHKPLQTFKDVIAPQINADDDAERVVLPTYWKDIMHLKHSGLGYVTSSMSGVLGKLWDIWKNKDFYGYEIRDPYDSPLDQAKDALMYVVPKPFSATSILEMHAKGESLMKQGLSLIGMTKAPAYLTHSDLENEIIDLYNTRNTTAQQPKSERKAKDAKHEITQLIKEKKNDEAHKKMMEYVQDGTLRPTQLKAMLHNARSADNPSVYFFTKLPFEDKIHLYGKMSAEEKKLYDPRGVVAREVARQKAIQERAKK